MDPWWAEFLQSSWDKLVSSELLGLLENPPILVWSSCDTAEINSDRTCYWNFPSQPKAQRGGRMTQYMKALRWQKVSTDWKPFLIKCFERFLLIFVFQVRAGELSEIVKAIICWRSESCMNTTWGAKVFGKSPVTRYYSFQRHHYHTSLSSISAFWHYFVPLRRGETSPPP